MMRFEGICEGILAENPHSLYMKASATNFIIARRTDDLLDGPLEQVGDGADYGLAPWVRDLATFPVLFRMDHPSDDLVVTGVSQTGKVSSGRVPFTGESQFENRYFNTHWSLATMLLNATLEPCPRMTSVKDARGLGIAGRYDGSHFTMWGEIGELRVHAWLDALERSGLQRFDDRIMAYETDETYEESSRDENWYWVERMKSGRFSS